MKTYRLSNLINFASMAAMAVLSPVAITSAHAAAAPSSLVATTGLQQGQFQRVEWWNDDKRHKLRHAYWLLEQGNKDYKGHRAAAMKEIKKASEMMGMELKGDGYGGERQPWSDERLKEARHLLQDVVDKSGGREHEHIRLAIKEIDRSLEVH